MSKYKTTWTELRQHMSEMELAYVVRYLDPKNGKRFAVPFKTQPDANKKRDQLKRDGAQQLSITKDYLKGKFKEDVSKDSAYAIGMAKAKDMYNDEPPVDKTTVTKAHDIAKAILRKEEFITEEQLIEQDKQDIQEFSRSQLDALARQYSDLKGKTISIDNANKLRKIFDKIPNHFLNDLRKKHIPFLSGLALSRMVQKGIPVREDTDYLKSKLNTHQINNIKNTWKSKTASDVTPAVKAMIKKMDIPTQIAIKQANIPHLSKLIEVNEDASDMAQAKATGTQKRIADLTTNINDKEDRARNINPGDKNKLAIHKADINHMKLKLADLKDKLRTDRHKRAMAAQNEPETDTSGKPNKKKEITENE